MWFPGVATESGVDEVRDIRVAQQVTASAGEWLPPTADLGVSIVTGDTSA